jgi:hypothetical protein
VNIHDPAEQNIPIAGLVKVKDSETGMVIMVDTNDPPVRNAFARNYEAQNLQFKEQFKRANCDTMSLATNQSYIQEFHRFFKSRASS